MNTPRIRENKILVKTIDIVEPPIRVRADSMRNTVIIDIQGSDYTKPQTFVLPRRFDVLDALGVALAHIARTSEAWDETSDSDS